MPRHHSKNKEEQEKPTQKQKAQDTRHRITSNSRTPSDQEN